MISRRKEEDLEGLERIENMKIGSDPFIVRSIININKQELGKVQREEWQNITKSQWQAARFMFYQKYWICLATSGILIGTCRKAMIWSTVASE